MSCRITYGQPLTSTDKLGVFDQFNYLRTKQIDKVLRDTKAIAEWEPHGIIAHRYLSFSKILLVYDDILLLECLSRCTKILTQSQYKDIPLKVQNYLFFYSCVLFTKTSNDLLLNICI